MQNFKISILVAIAALMITSCDKNVTMVTEINRDGTCTRQVSTSDDFLLYDESWEEVVPQDTADQKSFTLRRSFSSVEEMAANPVLSVYGEPVRSEASLQKRFKWFYTDYTFTETFAGWGDHFDIPITKFLSQDEASFMWTGYPNLVEGMTGIDMVDKLDKIQENLEYWEYSIILNCHFKLIANNYDDISNPPVNRDIFISLRDSVIKFGCENGYDEFSEVKLLLNDYFKSDAYNIFYSSSSIAADEFRDKYEAESDSIFYPVCNIIFLKAPYCLKMPGRVTDAGRGTLADGVIQYRFEGGFLVAGDYTITATSRVANVWAFILSTAIILLALLSLLYRRK
jgi:hypothetical protein